MSFTAPSIPPSLQLAASIHPYALTNAMNTRGLTMSEMPLGPIVNAAIGVMMTPDDMCVGNQYVAAKKLWDAYEVPYDLPRQLQDMSQIRQHRLVIQPLFREFVVPQIKGEFEGLLSDTKYALQVFQREELDNAYLTLAARGGIIDPSFVLDSLVPSMRDHANRVLGSGGYAFSKAKDFLNLQYILPANAPVAAGIVLSALSMSSSGAIMTAAGFLAVNATLGALHLAVRKNSRVQAEEGNAYAGQLEEVFKSLHIGQEGMEPIGSHAGVAGYDEKPEQLGELRVFQIMKNPNYLYSMVPVRNKEDLAEVKPGDLKRIMVAKDAATDIRYIRMLSGVKSDREELARESIRMFDETSILVGREMVVGAATLSIDVAESGETSVVLRDVFDPLGELDLAMRQKVGEYRKE